MHFCVCDFILDIVQNSVEAGSKAITLEVVEDGGRLSVAVTDDGRGMTEAELERAKDPFVTDGLKHARRKVGLGIPFLVQAVELAGGGYELESAKGKGTEFRFWFPLDGVDTPPVGDLPGLFRSVMAFDGDHEFVIRRSRPAGGVDYEVRKSELREAAGDFTDAGALTLVLEFFESQETV